MPDESTTPDLVELFRRSAEALFRRDLDATMSVYAPGAVFDVSALGIGSFEGRETIRRHFEDWIAPYEEVEIEFVESHEVGNGVAFAVLRQTGRPQDSTGRIQQRPAMVYEWIDRLIVRVTVYDDIDQARAAAERLAEERA
jgi:ketosteroid isomerase-like protein